MSSSSTLHIILGNCLLDDITPLSIKDDDVILMIEDESLCTHFKYHKHKIILFLPAMRNYKNVYSSSNTLSQYKLIL